MGLLDRLQGKTKIPEPPPEHYAVPGNVAADLVPIGQELSRLEESARWSSQNQFEAGKFWRGCNLALGVPASVLGLATGAAGVSEALPIEAVGIAALGAAALTAIMTVLGAERRSQRAHTCANAFHDIQGDARRMLLVDLSTTDLQTAREDLTILTDRYSEIRHTAEAPAKHFYNKAAKNIRKGGQRFAIDQTSNTALATKENTHG